MQLPEGFLEQALMGGLARHRCFDQINQQLEELIIPKHEVIFYSVLLDSLMSLSVAPCQKVRFEIYSYHFLAASHYSNPVAITFPYYETAYLQEPELASPIILEALLCLGATLLYAHPELGLFDFTASIQSRLFVKAVQNVRLQSVLNPYFQISVNEKTDNPEALLADSDDPYQILIEEINS